MKKSIICAAIGLLGLSFGSAAIAQTMTKEAYKVAKTVTANDYKAAKANCKLLKANAKDVCMAEAKGKENIALAELARMNMPSQKTRYDVRMATAQAIYSVSNELCDEQAGNAKDVCVKTAKAVRVRARADAKTELAVVDASKAYLTSTVAEREQASKKVAEVRSDGAADKRTADYKVAVEKCDALAGAVKDQCVAEAKMRFGK